MPLLDANDPAMRERAVKIIADMKEPRFLEPLITALQDKDMRVRKQAADGLKKLGAVAVEHLVEAVKSKDGDVQWRAVQALGEIDDRRSIDALVPILEDDDQDVRLKAAEVLEHLGWIPETETEQIWNHIARQEWDELLPFSAKAVPAVIIMVNDYDRHVRRHAQEFLHQFLPSVETIVFGTPPSDASPEQNTLWNVDLSSLSIPLPSLKQIIIAVESYDFRLVERFLTYAVNYVGQEHLKKQVIVSVYGDIQGLNPNLRNALTNLCQQIKNLP
jgi:hypothetical protein